MLVYNYDENTKEYLGSEEAYIDPIATATSGTTKYFVPINTTTIIPPEAPNGFVQVYENNSWQLVRDNREKWQISPSNELSVIDYIGEPTDGSVVLTEAQYQQLLVEPEYYIVDNGKLIKNPKWNDIEAERLAKLSMTKWDFVKYILNPHNFTYTMLKEVLAKDVALEEAWECCSAVYRGDDTLCTNLPKLLPTVTTAFLDEAFKNHGTYGG